AILLERQQACVAAGGGCVDGHGPLGREAVEIARPAGLRPGAAEPFAAKGLDANDRADRRAVDIAVADAEPPEDMAHGIVDPAVDAEGQGVAGRGDLVAYRVQPIGAPPDDMQDRAEHLALESARRVDLESARREKRAVLGAVRQLALVEETARLRHPRRMPLQRLPRRL